ncbi:MAG: class II aldolase/adducin family protein [Lentisphaeria bacterium]
MFVDEKNLVASFMRRLYRQGLTTTSGGNVSWRVSGDYVLLTPSKLDKGELKGEEIGVLTIDGKNLTPDLPPSIEADMHLAIYKARPDVRSVVHAHPLTATALAATGVEINCRYIAESYAIVGTPVRAPYAMMGTPALAENVSKAARDGNCVILDNHGVLAVGSTLLEAFDRLEVLERAAHTMLLLRAEESKRELTPEQLAALDTLMKRK